MKTKYMLKEGFNPDRREYAFGPRYDASVAEEAEAAIVPTTACLRCHEVRPSGKARIFESIPALAFDPLDEKARETWPKSAPEDRKRHVLSRLLVRLYRDSDMPPSDAPEQELFRVKEAAAFDQLKGILEKELDKVR